MPKLAFNLTADTVALVDSDQSRLWVVYTLEQYAAIDADHAHSATKNCGCLAKGCVRKLR